MVLWEVFVIVSILSIICEMLFPAMFFLNLAFAGLVTAVLSLYIKNGIYLTLIFTAFSLIFIFLLRPLLLKNRENKLNETGMMNKYVGKIVKTIEPVNRYAGAITIYDERWEARIDGDDEIPAGTEVKIVKYDSLILTVERI